jgi:glycosyltransferase involved in cell wall biosynthesis
VLLRLQRQDGRIKLINQPRNLGTYVARNQVLQQAQGRYFTVLDADDIALPHRLALQVQHLEQSGHVGVLTDWVRVEQDGRVALRSTMGGMHQHEAGATLMVDRVRALALVGYWDAVRFAADTEYIFRLRKRLGDEAVVSMGVPTVLALQHAGSLTSDPETGIDTISVGNSPVRSRYKKAWQQWHQKTPEDGLYLPFPQQSRQFDAPTEMKVKLHG